MKQNSEQLTNSISITRAAGKPLLVSPDTVIFNLASFGVSSELFTSGLFRLIPPAGWQVRAINEHSWRAIPFEIDLDRPVIFRLEVICDSQSLQIYRSVPVLLDLHSTFDPDRHPFPQRNHVTDIGVVPPQRNYLPATYSYPTGILGLLLFTGLYSDIVFLAATNQNRGGLCSGMARWSISRAIAGNSKPVPRSSALEQIVIFHGRQLTDRALLAGLPWLVRGSPKAAYRAVRRDFIEDGVADRALDIGVPKLWRRDIFQALIRQGHTVVPYRLRQESPTLATLDVYDPNMAQYHSTSPQTIGFQLHRNRYQYRHMVKYEDSGVGLIAVRQCFYERKGTAILATIASAGILLSEYLQNFRKRVMRRVPD